MLTMKLLSAGLLALGAISAQGALLKPYEQCGGLTWKNAYECEAGYSCEPAGDNAFPNYECYPNIGPIVSHTLPWGQCGGQGYNGPRLCTFGWDCVVMNLYHSQCLQNADYIPPALTPTPNLSGPGSFCGDTGVARGFPAECIPGFTCTGPGVYGYWVCTRTSEASTLVPVTTLKTSTSAYTSTTTTSKSITKSTTKTTTKRSTKTSTKSSVKASPTK
ncbi:hypothetical protein VTL71DRAFT_14129 [Oculimacula yallundae]|uniref:CBM1 domain-containing protein n=1 Tax=Oculimacula yallundae TaxID=86028 RepID=A0ABR4CHL8_9HELO